MPVYALRSGLSMCCVCLYIQNGSMSMQTLCMLYFVVDMLMWVKNCMLCEKYVKHTEKQLAQIHLKKSAACVATYAGNPWRTVCSFWTMETVILLRGIRKHCDVCSTTQTGCISHTCIITSPWVHRLCRTTTMGAVRLGWTLQAPHAGADEKSL